jgi:uncharacterized protein
MYYLKYELYLVNNNNHYFCYFTENNSLLEINKLAYHILKLKFPINHKNIISYFKSKYTKIEIEETINDLLFWKIISNDKNNKAIVNESPIKNPFNYSSGEKHIINGVYLVISQCCNLRCKYCSADYGRFGGKECLMDKYIAKLSIDFLLDNINQKSGSTSVIFVGGEPLLNFNIIKFVVDYIKHNTKINNFKFALNTNGSLMTENIANWLISNNIFIRFSIDGLKELHNENRVYPNGDGSYDDVINGLNRYLNIGKNKSFEAQTSIPKGDKLIESVHHLWNMGATNVICNFTSESYFIENDSFKMNRYDYNRYYKQWKSLCDEVTSGLLENNKSKGIAHFQSFLKNLHLRKKHINTCSVGRTISIMPDGSIYPCQGFTGMQDYCIGDIINGFDYNKLKVFGDIFVKYINKCNNCWARRICGMACISMSAQYNELSDKYEPTRICHILRKMAVHMMFVYSQIKKNNPKFLDQILS